MHTDPQHTLSQAIQRRVSEIIRGNISITDPRPTAQQLANAHKTNIRVYRRP